MSNMPVLHRNKRGINSLKVEVELEDISST